MDKDTPKITRSMANEIKRRQRLLADLEDVFGNAEACGVDCTDRRALRDSIQDQFTKILQHFAP